MPAESATREQILRAATDLFWARGYAATSLADIVRRAGIHNGSLYHFFSRKEDLLLAVLDGYLERVEPGVDEVARRSDDPIERIMGLLARYREHLDRRGLTRGCPIGNLSLELSDTHPEVRRKLAAVFDSWREAIRRCLDPPGSRLAHADREQLATFVISVLEGAVMQARAQKSLEPFDASVRQLRVHLERVAASAATAAGRP